MVTSKTLNFKNCQTLDKTEIPCLNFEEFAQIIEDTNFRIMNLIAHKEEYRNILFAVIEHEETLDLYILSTIVGNEYPAFTPKRPAVHMFEREIYETRGITPVGHPFLKPVKKKSKYEFLKSDDNQSHEVAVGPVHAGIIEPGHFRFLCQGERVMHLEIQLGYQHRGVEKIIKNKPTIQLAESICGDTTIGHALTFARAIEALRGIDVCPRAKTIRKIALEMERIAIHIGDLGAIAGDVAYLMGAEVLAVTRTLVINTMLEICGSRFGKGLIKIGGVNFDIDEELKNKIKTMLAEVETRTTTMTKAMFSNATVLSRLENTGTVSTKRAEEIGMVGPAARACGIKTDCRVHDDYKNFSPVCSINGDVLSRAFQRLAEFHQSKKLILEFLEELQGELTTPETNKPYAKNSFCISLTEGWRGEICHIVITDEKGEIAEYKIKDPSFNNWYGLALAVRNNQISDFPVCNKSFNLSYCGFDL